MFGGGCIFYRHRCSSTAENGQPMETDFILFQETDADGDQVLHIWMRAARCVFSCSLLTTFVGGADFLYTYKPQALVGHFSVRFGQVITSWDKAFGLPVAIYFRYSFYKRMWKYTCRHHVLSNKCSPAGLVCGLPMIFGGTNERPAITTASVGQHYITKVV